MKERPLVNGLRDGPKTSEQPDAAQEHDHQRSQQQQRYQQAECPPNLVPLSAVARRDRLLTSHTTPSVMSDWKRSALHTGAGHWHESARVETADVGSP